MIWMWFHLIIHIIVTQSQFLLLLLLLHCFIYSSNFICFPTFYCISFFFFLFFFFFSSFSHFSSLLNFRNCSRSEWRVTALVGDFRISWGRKWDESCTSLSQALHRFVKNIQFIMIVNCFFFIWFDLMWFGLVQFGLIHFILSFLYDSITVYFTVALFLFFCWCNRISICWHNRKQCYNHDCHHLINVTSIKLSFILL